MLHENVSSNEINLENQKTITLILKIKIAFSNDWLYVIGIA